MSTTPPKTLVELLRTLEAPGWYWVQPQEREAYDDLVRRGLARSELRVYARKPDRSPVLKTAYSLTDAGRRCLAWGTDP